MPRRGLQEREFFLICQYYTSKKTQDEFAEWAANQNKVVSPGQRLGTGSTSPDAIKKCLTRAIKKNRKDIKTLKSVGEVMSALGY